MQSKQNICTRMFRRYQQAGKGDKGRLLDEYPKTLGYNRDYLAHLLTHWGTTRYVATRGKSVKIVAGSAPQARKNASAGAEGGRPRTYGADFAALLYDIGEFFDGRCGKLLAPMFRLMADFHLLR